MRLPLSVPTIAALSWLAGIAHACGGTADEQQVDIRCESSFRDCDGLRENGCETDIHSSPLSCSACGLACPDGLACAHGVCRPPSDIVELGVGAYHTCVRRAGGSVSCWGENDYGELGDGTTTTRARPRPVAGVHDAAELTAGGRAACVRRRDNAFWCWGANTLGDLGAGFPSVAETSPVHAVEFDGFVHVTAAGCGLHRSGSVACLGSRVCGAAGDGLSDQKAQIHAKQLAGIEARQVSGRCARRRDGAVYCWGPNDSGQHGLGDTTGCEDFGPIKANIGITKVPAIDDATYISGDNTNCAIRAGGAVDCWGLWGGGSARVSPTRVEGVNDAMKVASGLYHGCALLRAGLVTCWGGSREAPGVLGSEREPSDAASLVPGLDEVVDMGVGGQHTCALRRNGEVLCWGMNLYGALGYEPTGPRDHRVTPTLVQGL